MTYFVIEIVAYTQREHAQVQVLNKIKLVYIYTLQ